MTQTRSGGPGPAPGTPGPASFGAWEQVIREPADPLRPLRPVARRAPDWRRRPLGIGVWYYGRVHEEGTTVLLRGIVVNVGPWCLNGRGRVVPADSPRPADKRAHARVAQVVRAARARMAEDELAATLARAEPGEGGA